MQNLSDVLAPAASAGHEGETPYGAGLGLGLVFVAVGTLAYLGVWL
jgi:hypothetical protein